MQARMYVVPCEHPDSPSGHFVVRDPERNFQVIPPEGCWINPSNVYWQAQLRDRSIEEAEPPSGA